MYDRDGSVTVCMMRWECNSVSDRDGSATVCMIEMGV